MHLLTCLVAHPSPVYRRGLCSAVAESGMRVHEVVDGAELPYTSGAAVLLTAVAVGEPPPSLASITGSEDPVDRMSPVVVGLLPDASPDTYWDAIALGWDSVVFRDAPVAQILDVVDEAVRGRTLLPHEVVRALFGPEHPPSARLPRERDEDIQWLRALGAGHTVAQLAKDSGYSEREMYRRLHQLYQRLGVTSKTDALIVATRRGLI